MEGVELSSAGNVAREDGGDIPTPCARAALNALRHINITGMLTASPRRNIGLPTADKAYTRLWHYAASFVHVFDGEGVEPPDINMPGDEPMRDDEEDIEDEEILPSVPLTAANPANPLWGQVATVELYKYERIRLAALGKTQETMTGHAIYDHRVQGICDLSLLVLRALMQSTVLLRGMAAAMGAEPCASMDLRATRAVARKQLEALCFDRCTAALQDHVGNLECDEVATTEFFTDFVANSEACTDLPSDTVEGLTEFVMQKKCAKFHTPSPLWSLDDMSVGTVSQTGNNAVCGTSGDSPGLREYTQKGRCFEGTKCKCPATTIKGRRTYKDLLQRSGESSLYVKGGSASGPMWTAQYAQGFVMSTVIQATLLGLSVPAALSSTITLPLFLLTSTAGRGLFIYKDYYTFSCLDTLGCWPSEPVRDAGRRCRMPEKVATGGSPLWWMPPPGLKLEYRQVKGCIVTNCGPDELRGQTIGAVSRAGSNKKEGIANCQPLTFQDMNGAQRRMFLEHLEETGLHEEYNFTSAYELVETEDTVALEHELSWSVPLDELGRERGDAEGGEHDSTSVDAEDVIMNEE